MWRIHKQQAYSVKPTKGSSLSKFRQSCTFNKTMTMYWKLLLHHNKSLIQVTLSPHDKQPSWTSFKELLWDRTQHTCFQQKSFSELLYRIWARLNLVKVSTQNDLESPYCFGVVSVRKWSSVLAYLIVPKLSFAADFFQSISCAEYQGKLLFWTTWKNTGFQHVMKNRLRIIILACISATSKLYLKVHGSQVYHSIEASKLHVF